MTSLIIGAGLVVNDWTPSNLVFPLSGKVLFTIKSDGSIERGEGFTTEDEMSLHFWEMIGKLGVQVVVRKGWKLAPLQPTPEMLDAAGIPRIAAVGVWDNMMKAVK